MIPKMAPFNGKVDEGFTFLETFKIQATGLTELQRIKTFGALCGPQAGHWFQNGNFLSWESLEDSFKMTWCKQMPPNQAIVKVSKVHQKEHEYIHGYIVRFKEYR